MRHDAAIRAIAVVMILHKFLSPFLSLWISKNDVTVTKAQVLLVPSFPLSSTPFLQPFSQLLVALGSSKFLGSNIFSCCHYKELAILRAKKGLSAMC